MRRPAKASSAGSAGDRARRLILLGGIAALSCAALVAPGSAAADSCQNAAVRALQGAAFLPECRAYEQVSPAEKGAAAEVEALGGGTFQAAPQGDAVVFDTTASLPGAISNVLFSTNRAVRGPGGWTAASIDPPLLNPSDQQLFGAPWVSRDLTHAVIVSKLSLTPDSIDGQDHVYVEDLETGQRQLVAQAPSVASGANLFFSFAAQVGGAIFGATPDLSHLAFTIMDPPLFPGVAPGQYTVYDWADGELRLAARQGDGTPFPGQSTLFGEARSDMRVISEDGSRVFFSVSNAPPGSQPQGGAIYMRENGTTTKLISSSHKTGADPATLDMDIAFQTISSDGRYVFFTAMREMNDEPIGAEGVNGALLYRYDTVADRFLLLADGSAVVTRLGVLAASPDGQRIYFAAEAPLIPGAPEMGVYLWDHGTVKLVTGFDGGRPELKLADEGRFASIRWIHNANRAAEAYAYDSESEELDCMSCPPSGPSRGDAEIGWYVQRGLSPEGLGVTADGTYVFDTPNGLVPEDTDDGRDVYEWKDGQVALLSSGDDAEPVKFIDMSADATDVFVATRAQLVAQDRDGARDLYDLRRDGGFVAQSISPVSAQECELDACQGPQGLVAPPPSAGSARFAGPGNAVKPRKRCQSLRAAAKSAAKARKCRVAKKQQKRRAANRARGAGR